jgi:hypothetical protein
MIRTARLVAGFDGASGRFWETAGMTGRIIKWVRQWGGSDRVIWVNVNKLNASWKWERGYYIRRGGRSEVAMPRRYSGVGEWVRLGRKMWMPHICLDQKGNVSFTDGRHRFAWMRDHGVKAIPVTAHPSDAHLIAKRFGSRSRMCHLPND